MKIKTRNRNLSDVVMIVNGHAVTVADIKNNRQRDSKRVLDRKRQSFAPIRLPGFVWVFYNPHFAYMGWWLYVRTRLGDIGVNFNSHYIHDRAGMIDSIRAIYPSGAEGCPFEVWCAKFCDAYPRPGQYASQQGRAPVYVTLSHNHNLKKVEGRGN